MNDYEEVRLFLDNMELENQVFEEGYDMGYAHGREHGYTEGVIITLMVVGGVASFLFAAVLMGWVV